MTKPATIHLKDYAPTPFTITEVNLTFELAEDVTVVTSELSFKRQTDATDQVRLNGEALVLKSVFLDGAVLSKSNYTLTDKDLTFIAPSDEFKATIVTEIKPQENTALEGLYKSSGNFCTQCEAEGFRKITYYLDRPDVMARFTTSIIGDGMEYPVMLSNGNLVSDTKLEDGRVKKVWEDPHPKPAYLFALVAGKLACVEDEFVTASGRKVALQIFIELGNEDKCDHAMTSLKKSMKWDEEKYGREYDLDVFMIVAVGDFNMGAMENKGLNIFNSKYVLASSQTATDTDFDGIESVIAHEYFHNWTGNRITCRDWFQLTLKEGLTVFRDQQFSADMNSAAVKRIDDVQRLRAAQFPEDAGPLAHPIQPQSYVEINNFYTATVYEKGAEIIRMMHTLAGPEGFRKGMDIYFDRHDGQAVTTEEFVSAIEAGSGLDLKQFRNWYIQPGTPEIAVEDAYNETSSTYELTFTQKNVKAGEGADPLHIPVAMGLLDEDGNSLLDDDLLHLTKAKQTFTFENIPSKPIPSLFRKFSAPIKITRNPADEKLGLLFRNDSDEFNRWEAGQQLALQGLLADVELYASGQALTGLSNDYTEAFGEILDDQNMDPAFKAEVLTLPSESYIGQQMKIVDVDAIHTVRKVALKSLGKRFETQLKSIYADLKSHNSMGARALKNLCLSYLVASSDDYLPLASEQYFSSENMTDRMASLARLVNSETDHRAEALQNFYDNWKEDQLVLDKWFMLQATSSRSSTMDDVKGLLAHPDFTMLNPNRVRSLIAAFAGANPIHFHNENGGGYQFLADRIIELNSTNPQIAARLVAPLGQWRRHNETRQGLMQAELRRILETENISNDVYEMANKSLSN
ncbi:aminopeptidase N [Sneathiella sp. P13V-1]|uniref:aminopeptidase N n=1 Tax=Sneathiella sp. P13V-1 TaxID=2697366 RepID=UPI00187BA989|nr:aminopeptidase N [Sneathiella sp. P13V-1]MBE7638322.1 aminopeptidase N [Sneathiella sp. P13V-1]